MESNKIRLKTFLNSRVTTIAICLGLILSNSMAKGQNILDNYINDGLKNNIVVKEKNLSFDKANYALKEARTLFLPSVNFIGTYTSGEGGRTIPLPIGDLLNPVYTTLNKMTQSKSFPQVSNESIGFFPVNFYDAKVRISGPLYDPAISGYLKIKKDEGQLQEFELLAYKRELVKDIKTAYFNYLMSMAGVQIYQNATVLIDKNVSVNKSLLNNGKGLPASVLRAESEAQSIRSQLLDAQNTMINARHYFNFLLNRNLDEPIDTSFDKQKALGSIGMYIGKNKITSREELKMANLGEGIYSNAYTIYKQFWIPKLSGFVDLGSQASNFVFNSESKYYLVGAQLDFPIFAWGRNNFKARQFADDYKTAALNTQYLTTQLQLSSDMAKSNLETTYDRYQTSLKEATAAQSYFKLIEIGVKEGVNSQIEFIDARNQLTNSQIAVNINLFKVLQCMAAVERETATYTIQK